MNKKMWSVSKSMLCAAGLALSGFTNADMTGTWNLTVETAQGSGNPSFTLVEEGGQLSGTYTGMMGSVPVTGLVENDTFKITYSVEAQGMSMNVQYSGILKDDSTIEGKLNMADFAEGTFTGKRQ